MLTVDGMWVGTMEPRPPRCGEQTVFTLYDTADSVLAQLIDNGEASVPTPRMLSPHEAGWIHCYVSAKLLAMRND